MTDILARLDRAERDHRLARRSGRVKRVPYKPEPMHDETKSLNPARRRRARAAKLRGTSQAQPTGGDRRSVFTREEHEVLVLAHKLGMTATELARDWRVPRSTMSDWLNRPCRFSAYTRPPGS